MVNSDFSKEVIDRADQVLKPLRIAADVRHDLPAVHNENNL